MLYIDPGTGSMLFSILISAVSILVFFLHRLYMRVKFIISGGKAARVSNLKIPYLIFSDHKRYWNVFKPICDEFENRGIDLVYWTTSPNDPALIEKYQHIKTEFIGEGNKAFVRLNMVNACIVLATTPGLDVYQWKRSKNVDWYVHIFHSVSDGTGYRMFGLYAYDAILVGGPITEYYLRKLDDLRDLPQKEIIISGITYMDSLKRKFETVSLRKENNDEDRQKTILLAPSWGNSAILSKYGSKILKALVATENKIIVRPHPQSLVTERKMLDDLMKEFPEDKNFIWDVDSDSFDTLNESDIMISDFSGVIYDYALVFNRPVIYAESMFDSSQYDAAWIDEEKWMIKKLSALGHPLRESDFSDMSSVIENAICDNKFAFSRKQLSVECWAHVGEASKVSADYLIKKHDMIMKNDTRYK